jgi:hypothetical protein
VFQCKCGLRIQEQKSAQTIQILVTKWVILEKEFWSLCTLFDYQSLVGDERKRFGILEFKGVHGFFEGIEACDAFLL